jgi:hypothetical protein
MRTEIGFKSNMWKDNEGTTFTDQVAKIGSAPRLISSTN